MTEQNEKTLFERFEDHSACTAFAEAGEPCPISLHDAGTEKRSLEDDLACVAYHEVGEECPIPHIEQ